MKLKALVLALFALGIAAALAVSAPANPGSVPAKGRPTTAALTGDTTGQSTTSSPGKGKAKRADRAASCKPKQAIVLKGTYVAAGAGGFAMDVSAGNRAARGFVGKQATVLVNEQTRVTRRGRATAADLEAGDQLVVRGRACQVDAASGAVLARRVIAKPANADGGKKPNKPVAPPIGTTTGTTTS